MRGGRKGVRQKAVDVQREEEREGGKVALKVTVNRSCVYHCMSFSFLALVLTL